MHTMQTLRNELMASEKNARLGFVFFALLATQALADMKNPYKNPALPVEQRVSDLLSRMTLQEKIGQMTQIDRSVASPEVLQSLFIGSVLNGGGSNPATNATAEMWADMIDGFQTSAMATRLGIPVIYGTDSVHGHNNVVGATIFPHNVGLGAARDTDLMRRIGVATAIEVRATGIPYTFAPCLAVCRDPRWGRCYESFSEDTEVVRSMAEIIVGLQGSPPSGHTRGYPFVAQGGNKVAACAKHFTGDGGTMSGINENNTIASYPDLFRIHIKPYIDALERGVSTVMVSYSSWNGKKMHANPYLLTRVLKQEMGFQGLLISDWEGVDRISSPPGKDYRSSVLAAIGAGIDMVMVPYDYQRFITDVTDLVKGGRIPMSRIDDAVRRILRVKFLTGLFEQPLTNRTLLTLVGHKDHRKLAREAVRKSLVLLKNGKKRPMLPLNAKAPKILVTGTHAHNVGYQCGGWTVSWQGSSGATTNGTTILEGVRAAVSKRTEVVYEERPEAPFFNRNTNFSYAVVAVGEPPYAESDGDNGNLRIPLGGDRIIQQVCSRIRCVVILISGRPLVVEPYMKWMDALVAAWLPGSEAGPGIADVLFGRYDFTGKLPRTWFRRAEQLPMNTGDAHYDPLFPFGFGLRMRSPTSRTRSSSLVTTTIANPSSSSCSVSKSSPFCPSYDSA